MTSLLYSLSKLSLVISTSTCHTARKNFSSFSHTFSELSDIFVINCFSSVNAEHTNLFTASLYRPSGPFHDLILLTE